MSEANGTVTVSSREESPASSFGSPKHVLKFASKHIGHVGKGELVRAS